MRGFREIAERLAAQRPPVRVRVWLAGGVVEGAIEFVDGPLWVVAAQGSRTWVDEHAVQAVTVLEATQVTETLADAPSVEIAGASTLQARIDELADRFDCRLAGEPPGSDEGRAALSRLLGVLEAAFVRVVAARGDGFLNGGVRLEPGEPGVRRADGVLVIGYRPGLRHQADAERLAAQIMAAPS